MKPELAIILTARMASERLPGKVMADITGRPMLYWIARRLTSIGKVIIETTTGSEDDPVAGLAQSINLPCYRGNDDLVTSMDEALKKYHPDAKYVLRGLGDMPFMAGELVEHAVNCLYKYKGDAFAWALSPQTWPVYGSREFPYSRSAWNMLVRESRDREHVDTFYHRNRHKFNTIYHESPKNIYFRDYRLEVDWPEDMKLIREIGLNMSMLSPVEKVIKLLDSNNWMTKINRERVERTGPTTYSYDEKRAWVKSMAGKPILGWDNYVWIPSSSKAQPVLCKSGRCMIGLSEDGILFAKAGRIKGSAYLNCQCGSGLVWNG